MNLNEWDKASAASMTDEQAARRIGIALGSYAGRAILSGVTLGLEELAAEVVRDYRPIVLRSGSAEMAAAWNLSVENGYVKMVDAAAYQELVRKFQAYV